MCAMLCTGCSIDKTYYSKGKMKRFAKKLVSKDVDYKKKDMVEDYKVLYFEDSEGRPFTVFSYSKNIQVWNSYLPLYTKHVADTYQVSIFQYERENIQKILDETGLSWTELHAFDEETGEVEMMRESIGGYSIHMGINHGKPVEKEDLKIIAKAGAEIDQILHYDYNNEVNTKLAYQEQHLCGMRIVFCKDDEAYQFRDMEISFSTSEEDRWTEESLYARLMDGYEEYEKEVRIYKETPEKVIDHMEQKYGTEFVYDKELGVIGSPIRDNKVEMILYEKSDVERRFQIHVTAYGTANNGFLTYEDDYQDVLDYKEAVSQFFE